jgi:hypothetical protein
MKGVLSNLFVFILRVQPIDSFTRSHSSSVLKRLPFQQRPKPFNNNEYTTISYSNIDNEVENDGINQFSSESHVYKPKNLGDILRELTRNLVQLSLEDYKWRSNIFQTMMADRLLESSLARMRGESSPGYYRPMDAPLQGPLGMAEDSAVSWLSLVIEEEGRRAALILEQDGAIIRPIEVKEPGPLADIEAAVVRFLASVRTAEKLRNSLGILRPMDLEESQRGPLGNAEHRLSQALKDLANSEVLRYEQSKARGSSVRPMDIPGPLGEVEAAVWEIFRAEQLRAQEKKEPRNLNSLRPIRPKDAVVPGPLGEAEQKAIRAFQNLSEEERERLRGILKTIQDRRPMEVQRDSILGSLEAIIVGILRAPRLLVSVWDRVSELLQSKPLIFKDTPEIETEEITSSPSSKKSLTLKLPEISEEELGAFE